MRHRTFDNSDIPDEEFEQTVARVAQAEGANKHECSQELLQDLKALTKLNMLSRSAIVALDQIYNLQDYSAESRIAADFAPNQTTLHWATLKFFWLWANGYYGPIMPINNEMKPIVAVLQYEFKRLKEWSQIPEVRERLRRFSRKNLAK